MLQDKKSTFIYISMIYPHNTLDRLKLFTLHSFCYELSQGSAQILPYKNLALRGHFFCPAENIKDDNI